MAEHSQRLAIEGSDGVIRLSPPIWPNSDSAHQPGDLTHFAAAGTGVYGYQERSFNPFKMGPVHEPVGGVFFSVMMLKGMILLLLLNDHGLTPRGFF